MENSKLIAFDLDGTLAESKSPLDGEMSGLLCRLLEKKIVAVASGASFAQFENQFLEHFSSEKKLLKNLYLIPTNGAQLYRYAGAWRPVYEKKISGADKKNIFSAFEKALAAARFEKPEPVYGVLIEDRGSQITFSAFGSLAPLAAKKDWDIDHAKRARIADELKKYIPEFSIRIGGTSSIDITMEHVDKAYGLSRLMQILQLEKEQVLYVGDALFPGGNDASVLSLGIKTYEVAGVKDTKDFIRTLL